MFVVGPSGSGMQPSSSTAVRDTPLHDHVTSISTSMQYRSHSAPGGWAGSGTGDVVGKMVALGLAGLERVVEPQLNAPATAPHHEHSQHPHAVLEYNAHSAVVEEYRARSIEAEWCWCWCWCWC